MAQPNLTVTTLRAVATWLESHPEADVDSAQFRRSGSALHCYSVRDSVDLGRRALAIGGQWTEQVDEDVHLFRLRQEIVPGVWYELITNREDA